MTPGPDRIELHQDLASSIFGDPNLQRVYPKLEPLNDAVRTIEKRVFGQTQAAQAVAEAAIRVRAGMVFPGRPEFAGIFAGPPGVGKSEMGGAVAELYWGSNWEAHYKKIPCAIFNSEYAINYLTGSAPGIVDSGDQGGLLIHPDFMQERNVVVFDELEKGHPQLRRILLDILDGATLPVLVRKGDGGKDQPLERRELDFSKSTLILTTNIGSNEIQAARSGKNKEVGFGAQEKPVDVQKTGMDALEAYFGTMREFLDRIPRQNRIIFNPLTQDVWRMVFDKTLGQFLPETNGMHIMATTRLKDWIIGKVDPMLGARQLHDLIAKHIITQAALVKLDLARDIPLIAGVDEQDGEGSVVFKAYEHFLTPHRTSEADMHGGETKPRIIIPDENGYRDAVRLSDLLRSSN